MEACRSYWESEVMDGRFRGVDSLEPQNKSTQTLSNTSPLHPSPEISECSPNADGYSTPC